MTGTDYYLAQKKKLLKGHHKLMSFGQNLLSSRYDAAQVAAIYAETAAEFERLIPEIPYVGGSENPLTDTLIQMTSLLAFYRVMKQRDLPVSEIGEMVHTMAKTQIASYPRFVRMLIGRLYMSSYWRKRTAKKAAISQQREHPENFVFEVVEGDGENYEWGVNYIECGVVKYFHRMQADEFTPYMCFIDFLMYPGMGVDLHRTGTIGTGCTHCDFRFAGHTEVTANPLYPTSDTTSPPAA